MFDALVDAAAELADEPRPARRRPLRRGPSFCAGLDFGGASWRHRPTAELACSPARTADRRTTPSAPPRSGTELPVPVIAAMHGIAFGGGLQIALAADVRIAAPRRRLSVMEIKCGLDPRHEQHDRRCPTSSASTSPRSSPSPAAPSALRRRSSSASSPGSPTTRAPRRSRLPPRSPRSHRTRSDGSSASTRSRGASRPPPDSPSKPSCRAS